MKVLVLQHAAAQHLGLWGKLMAEGGHAPTVVRLYRNEAIPEVADYDAMLLLGGPMGAYDEREYSFLIDEDRAIKRALALGKPLLGLGLGGQLLAKALGARVYANPVKEIGFYPISLEVEGVRDRLFEGLGRLFTVFEWHGDTFDIPKGAVKLARSATCENQAFRYGDRAYAVLFHPQVTPAMVAFWAEEYAAQLETLHMASGVPALVQEAYRRWDRLQQQSRRLWENFAALAKGG